MTISSRTQEGESNQCPVCGAVLRIEPSQSTGDAPCPQCGHLLWFINTPQNGAPLIFLERDKRGILKRLADKFGILESVIETDRLRGATADSLDLVELVMELEENPPS